MILWYAEKKMRINNLKYDLMNLKISLMKSFTKYILKRYMYTNLVLVFLLMIILSLVSVNFYINELEDRYRTALLRFNSTIRALNNLNADLQKIENINENNQYLDELDSLLSELDDSLRGFPSHIFSLDEYKNITVEIKEGTPPQEFIRSLGEAAHRLADFYHKRSNLGVVIALTSLVSVAILVFFLAIMIKNLKNYFLSFYDKVHSGVDVLIDVLDYKDVKKSIDSFWEEEYQYTSAINKTVDRIKFDRKLSDIAGYGSMEDLLPKIFNLISPIVPCDRIGLAFIDQNKNVIAEAAISNLRIISLNQGYSEPISNTSLEILTSQREGRIINDLEEHYRSVNQSESTRLILREGIKSNITIPLFLQGSCHGFVFISSVLLNSYSESDLIEIQRIINPLSPTILNKYVTQLTISSTANAFIKLMEKKDNETSLHIKRMANYSYSIAKQLYIQNHPGLTHRTIREILLFAPLHDIGKIGIPDSILLKEGPLDESEFNQMKEHVELGAQVMHYMHENLKTGSGIDYLESALNIVIGHHEKFDGSGYPRGLKGRDIPIEGHICSLADVFDALTSLRPYKKAWLFDEAVEYIRKLQGVQFDPVVVKAFVDALPEISRIYSLYKEV